MHPRTTHFGLSAERRRPLWSSLAAVLAVGALGSAVLVQPPARTVEGRAVATVAAVTPVRLLRHTGTVTGDGETRYVANRTLFLPARAVVKLPPRLRARSWVVVDLDTGAVLGQHAARRRLPQASTLKLLTAVTAAQGVNRSVPHRVTRFEAHQTCTCAGLRVGRRYAFRTLLSGMLLPSGNDAAEAVAGSYPGGRWAFYAAMNRVAARLGATDTVAKNASGLTAVGSHSSARDLVLFLRAALARPLLVQIMSQRSARIAPVSGRRPHTVWRGTDYVNMYPGSLGKSGYTTPALNTLVVETEIDGHRIAVATMGAPGGYSTSGARALTMWADDNFAGLLPVAQLPAGRTPAPTPTPSASTPAPTPAPTSPTPTPTPTPPTPTPTPTAPTPTS